MSARMSVSASWNASFSAESRTCVALRCVASRAYRWFDTRSRHCGVLRTTLYIRYNRDLWLRYRIHVVGQQGTPCQVGNRSNFIGQPSSFCLKAAIYFGSFCLQAQQCTDGITNLLRHEALLLQRVCATCLPVEILEAVNETTH